MGILVVIALEANTVTKIVLAMESGIITINANANTATLGSITTIVLCSVIIIAIIIIAIEIAFSIETIVTIELIMVSITVITLELGIMSVFANEAFRAIEMSISCRGCRGIRSAQWQGELDGSDVTGRDVSWEMTEKRVRHGMVFPIGPVSKEFLFAGRWRKIRFVKGRRQTSSHDDYVAGIDVPWKDSIRCGIFRHVWPGSIGGFSLWRGRCNQTRRRKRKLHTRWSAISPNMFLCINRTETTAQNQLFCLARGT
jgi:hypothetical protein